MTLLCLRGVIRDPNILMIQNLLLSSLVTILCGLASLGFLGVGVGSGWRRLQSRHTLDVHRLISIAASTGTTARSIPATAT